MQLVVVKHDPRWAEMYIAESRLILQSLGPNAIAAHHIGSTAIPAAVAKPVIDILGVVTDLDAVDLHNADMTALGYEAKGEYGIPRRRYFRKDNTAGVRTHNVHVFQLGNGQIDRHLAFRDFMNAHPEWAGKYSTLKSELAKRHPNSIELYMDGKDSFIKAIDELASK